MRTVGVDLATEPRRTGVCVVTWTDGRAAAEFPTSLADDDGLLRVMGDADKVGVDCPFGWPDPFVDAIAAHARSEAWPGRGQQSTAFRRSLSHRLTDEVVWCRTCRWPLSVAADRIGLTAMRCAGLLDALALAGRPVDRAGSGLVAEVYPAAALHGWRLPDVGYKRAAGAAALGGLVDQLFDAAPFLALDADAEARCRASDDAFDALVAALVARAVTLGLTDPPNLEERERAGREGWIHLPRGGLSALVGES